MDVVYFIFKTDKGIEILPQIWKKMEKLLIY